MKKGERVRMSGRPDVVCAAAEDCGIVEAAGRPPKKWRLNMGFFAGSHRTGLLAILTALLLPALGVGVANAQMNVGDTIDLLVPDLSEFPQDPMNEGFTCRQ
jgi:hypothetical protein